MTPAEKKQRAELGARLAQRGVIIDAINIDTENPMNRLAMPAPPVANAPALPADPQAAIDAFTKAAGLPPDADPGTIDQMWKACIAAVSGNAGQLAPTELAAVRATPGCTPSAFLAAKRSMGGR